MNKLVVYYTVYTNSFFEFIERKCQIRYKKVFYLPDRYKIPSNGLQLSYWIKGDNGPIKLTVNNENAIFFIETEFAEQAIQILATNHIQHTTKPLELKTFNHTNRDRVLLCKTKLIL